MNAVIPNTQLVHEIRRKDVSLSDGRAEDFVRLGSHGRRGAAVCQGWAGCWDDARYVAIARTREDLILRRDILIYAYVKRILCLIELRGTHVVVAEVQTVRVR